MHVLAPTTPSSDAPQPRWHVVETDRWLDSALSWINEAASMALAERGRFLLVLAGGSTPERLYRALAQQTCDWTGWHVWFGDERCLPSHDAQRNSRMAKLAWLDQIDIPAGNVHVIAAELGAQAAAKAYSEQLQEQDDFDLVLLGLGQDGHTASLFPEQDWGARNDAPDALPVTNAPKPPPDRVTLSAHRLSRARAVLFLIRGADKRNALTRWQQGAIIPAAAIRPNSGIDLLIDTDVFPSGEPQ